MSFGSLQVLIFGVTFILLLDTGKAFCLSGTQFQWGINSLCQNPCEIAGKLLPVCSGGAIGVSPLKAGSTYPTSQTNGDGNRCFCSSVYYAIISACAQCQGGKWPDWDDQTKNCKGDTFIQSIDITIPSDTRLPSWAFLDYPAQGSFNLTAARADALHLTSCPSPTPTSSRTLAAPTPASPTLTSRTSVLTTSVSPTLTSSRTSVPPTSTSGTLTNTTTSPISTSPVQVPSGISALGDGERGRTNVGAIVGGVIGGVALLSLLILALCCLRRRRRNKSMRIDSIEDKTTLRSSPVNNANSTTSNKAPPANPADTSMNMSPNSTDQRTTSPGNTFQDQTHNRTVDTNPSNNDRILAEGQDRPGTKVVDRDVNDPGTHGSKKLCCK